MNVAINSAIQQLLSTHEQHQIATTMLPRAAFATLITTLTLCPPSAAILPLPRLTSTSTSTPLTGSLTTGITYHQGLVSSGNGTVTSGLCDAQVVAKGELTAGYCIGLQTYAISITRMESLECAFRVFHGSTACEADATDTMNVPIPSGDGYVCLITGIEDGGKFVKASGFLVCG